MTPQHKVTTHIKSSLIFVFLFYFLDSVPLYYTFSKSTAFNTTITSSLFTHVGVLSTMIFSLLGLLLILSLSLGAFTYIFKVRKSYVFFFLILFYSYTYNIVEQPSIFDDFIYLNYYVQLLNKWMGYHWVYITAFIIISFLNYNFFYSHKWKKKEFYLALTANLFLAYFFLIVQKPLDESVNKATQIDFISSQKTQRPPNIVFLGIDSLKEESFSDLQEDEILKLFLKKSTTFRSSISPIANTRPAYSSILSGKIPPNIEQRFPLRRKKSKINLQNSPLNDFKKNGYSIHYMLDDASYNKPEKDNVFKSIDSPANTSDMRKYVHPILLRSRVLFTFFNNDFGNLIFPGIYANFAYTYSYKVSGFKDKVNKKIDYLMTENNPFLLFVHTSSLHFPGNFRYPYYVRGGPQSNKALGFGSRAPYLNAISDSLPAPGPLTAQFYPDLYQGGVRMVKNHFINPILEHLSEKKLLENTIVIIFSDHGESFWNKQEIPRLKLPNHGTFLLGEDHSPKTFLSIYNPHSRARLVNNDFPLVNLLPYTCHLANLHCSSKYGSPFFAKSIYTETGMFPLKLFEDQFFFKKFRFAELFSVEDHGKVYLSREAIKPTLIQKSRAIYSHPYRLTLYLANDGYRLFLCNYTNDKYCFKNLVYSETAILKKLFKKLMSKVEQDIDNGYIPVLEVEEEDPLYASFLPKVESDHFLLLYAITSFNRNLNYHGSLKILESLAKKETAPLYVRKMSFEKLREVCELRLISQMLQLQASDIPSKNLKPNDADICEDISSMPPIFSESEVSQRVNPHEENDLLMQSFRESGSNEVLIKLQNSNLTTYQQKLLETLLYFKELKESNLTPENTINNIAQFLKKNYTLSTSLELREEFDLFWFEAFDFMENKFGQKGVYHLLLYQVLSYRISSNYFLKKVYPFIVKNKKSKNQILRMLQNEKFDSKIDLKKVISGHLASNYFCKGTIKYDLCLKLKKIESPE